MSRRWPIRPIGQPWRANATRANVGDVASCGAWLELTTPVGDQHLGEFAQQPDGFAVPFDLWSEHGWTEAAFPFSTTLVPIAFRDLWDVFAVNLEAVAVKTAAVHVISCGARGHQFWERQIPNPSRKSVIPPLTHKISVRGGKCDGSLY